MTLPLQDLYTKLIRRPGNEQHLHYEDQKNQEVLVACQRVKLEPLRIIESPSLEIVTPWEGEKTNVSYYGEKDVLQRLIQELRLPRNPSSNLGERILWSFDKRLQEQISGSYQKLKQEINKGKENHLELILARMLWVWNGRKIDSDFYASR